MNCHTSTRKIYGQFLHKGGLLPKNNRIFFLLPRYDHFIHQPKALLELIRDMLFLKKKFLIISSPKNPKNPVENSIKTFK
jgi:hypothetical protein